MKAWGAGSFRRSSRERATRHGNDRRGKPRPPFGELAAAGFPKLVISGGHASVFEAVYDTLADLIKAGRAIVPGRQHTIPAVGDAYDSRVHEFLSQVEAMAP